MSNKTYKMILKQKAVVIILQINCSINQ